jgi:hypothetical protein
MLMEEVESAKQKYTDQYVAIASRRPDLMRFAGLVGQVKTVNMSGRALVEWVNYFDNIGWYDIDLRDLMIVPKPAEPEVVKPAATAKTNDGIPSEAAAKPKAGMSPLELLRQQATAKKESSESEATTTEAAKPEARKLSPIEILKQQAAAKKAAEEGKAE